MLLASVILIIVWNIIWITCFCETRHVMVGTGDKDDSDDYEEQSKGTYIAGYVIVGILLLALIVAFIYIVEQYKEKMKDG